MEQAQVRAKHKPQSAGRQTASVPAPSRGGSVADLAGIARVCLAEDSVPVAGDDLAALQSVPYKLLHLLLAGVGAQLQSVTQLHTTACCLWAGSSTQRPILPSSTAGHI